MSLNPSIQCPKGHVLENAGPLFNMDAGVCPECKESTSWVFTEVSKVVNTALHPRYADTKCGYCDFVQSVKVISRESVADGFVKNNVESVPCRRCRDQFAMAALPDCLRIEAAGPSKEPERDAVSNAYFIAQLGYSELSVSDV